MVAKRDLFLGLLVIMAWAGNATALKFITIELEPFTALTLRLILGSIIFLPFLRWPGKEKFWLILQIVFFLVILHWTSLTYAVDKLEASMAAILLQIQVIFTTIIGYFFYSEKIGWKTLLGIAIGILGIIILVGMPENPPSVVGVSSMIFSMLAFAISYTRMKKLTSVSPATYIAFMHILGLLPVAAIAFLIEKPLETEWHNVDTTIVGLVLIYQIFCVGGAHMLWQRLMTRNEMTSLPNLTLLIPVFGVIFAMILLGDIITPTMIIGGIVTTLGVSIVMIRKQKRTVG